ncbi:unnamed protein product [Anisakis simplex]|uniref:Piezo non-specific cation channel R-Ras-binding domain-containing protein n=1 Tax=Anisakis simplex TaxID=6269 RepID=A0A0M3J5J3_ANISI|nr:unnamed protein product [Anisakis simplex]
MARSEPFTTATAAINRGICGLLVKYWIFVVAVVLLLVSVQSPPLCYTIGYFLFFALLLTFLQISFGCFRKTLFAYWTLLVIYSSLVLLAIYCFQFPGIPEYWFRFTGLSKQWTDDIGLINYKDEKRDSTILFVRLFAPVSFCIVAMLQLKFFHSPWSKMVSTANSNTQQTGGALVQGLFIVICYYLILLLFIIIINDSFRRGCK